MLLLLLLLLSPHPPLITFFTASWLFPPLANMASSFTFTSALQRQTHQKMSHLGGGNTGRSQQKT